jgi:hypothetical protein
MEIQLDSFRRYLQPSPTLRWHPWAPLAAAILLIAFVFALGAAWGDAAAMRRAADLRVYTEPSFRMMERQLEATRPARHAFEFARSLDAAVIRAAREAQAEKSPVYRMRVSLEESVFGFLEADRHTRNDIDRRQVYRDSARLLAEYRLKNLAGSAADWQPTATLCRDIGRGWELGTQLDSAAWAYSAILGRTITAQQLAPLSGAACS